MTNSLMPEYQSVKGMPDVLPLEARRWQAIEQILTEIVTSYGYDPIRLPILEKTALFKRAVGSTTDIVSKEMFTLLDEKQRSLVLRPEGTASCVRSCLEHGLLRQSPQKLWYLGPMFRYEAPQKGRQRQFHQLGVECFGVPHWHAECEQIMLMWQIFKRLGLQHLVKLELNNLGDIATRQSYLEVLVKYFGQYLELLDQDSVKRLTNNPLRILDSKNPRMQDIISNAPTIDQFLSVKVVAEYHDLKQELFKLGIPYTENPRIVRGLDYYSGTVWEWSSAVLGAQSAVAAGGRYDALVSNLGGPSTAAVGFALGLERLMLLTSAPEINIDHGIDAAYLVCTGEALNCKLRLADRIRNKHPRLVLHMDLNGGSFKQQFKRADRSLAKYALVIGDDELNKDLVTIKFLREDRQQLTIEFGQLGEILSK